MSEQSPITNAEVLVINPEGTESFQDKLRANAAITETPLHHGASQAFSSVENLSSVSNAHAGVRQELKAVIKASDTYFGLVAISSLRPQESGIGPGYALSKFTPGEGRGELVGLVSDNETLAVGRNHQGSLREDKGISRDHFSVRVIDGVPHIIDQNSSNGTSVFSPENKQASINDEGQVSLGGFRALWRAKKAEDLQQQSETDGAISDMSWAVKSAEIRDSMDSTAEKDEYLKAVVDRIWSEIGDNVQGGYDGDITKTKWGDTLSTIQKVFKSCDVEVARGIYDIFVNKQLKGAPIPEQMGKWSHWQVLDKRTQLMNIYLADQEAAEAIVSHDVSGFHASTSSSLESVLSHGLLPADELSRQQILTVSGERRFSTKGGQRSISFVDWREPDVIAKYSYGFAKRLSSESLRHDAQAIKDDAQDNERSFGADHPFAHNGYRLSDDLTALASKIDAMPPGLERDIMTENFPIAYGISTANLKDVSWLEASRSDYKAPKQGNVVIPVVRSDVEAEFMTTGEGFSLQEIPVIAVPKEKVNLVQNLVNSKGGRARVIPLEAIVTS